MGWGRAHGRSTKLARTTPVPTAGPTTTPTSIQHPKWYKYPLTQGFQFAVGDIINIRVDFQKSIAIYTKNSTVSYEQPIKLDLGAIYAFAGPTNLNDVIAIL